MPEQSAYRKASVRILPLIALGYGAANDERKTDAADPQKYPFRALAAELS
jgi:hypothetical protein